MVHVVSQSRTSVISSLASSEMSINDVFLGEVGSSVFLKTAYTSYLFKKKEKIHLNSTLLLTLKFNVFLFLIM